MATIRFIREGVDISCERGENLRDVINQRKNATIWVKGFIR